MTVRPFDALEEMSGAGIVTVGRVGIAFSVVLQVGEARFVGKSDWLPNAITVCFGRWKRGEDDSLPLCRSGKRSYTEAKAEEAAADTTATNIRRGRPDVACRSYRCPICSCWHVTSQPLRNPAQSNSNAVDDGAGRGHV